MAKMDKYERRLASYAIRNSKVLTKLFDELQNKLIQLGLKADNLHPDDLFTFARKAPQNVQKEVDKLLSDFHDKVVKTITEGIDWAYGLSIRKNNALFGELFHKGYNLSFNRRNTAKNAYIADRLSLTNGLNLSDRVWNYTNQQRAEFETAISVALEDGTDNETLGRNIRKYLKDPDMCYKRYHLKKVLKNGDKKDVVKWYKRVIGDDGKVHYVQADPEHVGRGVYRSARKNTLRTSRTEINMAYRSADNEAYKSTPFVLGIEVQLSNNHPEGDICDELAGRYPRDFVFIGWHPLCRCHAVPILPSVDDMAKYINAGSPAGYFDKRYVDDVPDAFKDWVKTNKEKIESDKWKNPYFVDANKGVVDRVLGNAEVDSGGELNTRDSNQTNALNKEYKGEAEGKDITSIIDASTMESEDKYVNKQMFTLNVARMQGFDAPAKLVSEQDFKALQEANGDVLYRTVNATTFNGKQMSSAEFASQIYTADKMPMNGGGYRAYGDGIYATTSVWDGHKTIRMSEMSIKEAYDGSRGYRDKVECTTLEMTWTRKPKIIEQQKLLEMWKTLPAKQKKKYSVDIEEYKSFSNYANTYACALGYDAMYCRDNNYIVIWNRTILAVKKT